jgi:flagellar basal-body rod protein FlgB
MFSIDPTLELLSRGLDACTLRQAVYAANIANADTPGYQPLEVDFESDLQNAAQLTAGAPWAQQTEFLRTIEPRIVQSTADTVQLDQQVGLMAKNAIHYQQLLGAFERSISLLRLATLEGREGS